MLHVARRGAAFVVGPQHVQRMTVTVRGVSNVVGEAVPVGASRLGHGVTAVQLPPDLRPDEPIVVRLEPPGAGSARIVADDSAVDIGIASARAGGVMLGVLLAVLIFQIAGWVITREPSIPFYALYVAGLASIELLRDGLFPLPQAVPPLSMMVVLDSVTGIAAAGFVAVYLRLWQDDRRLLWLLVAGLAPKFLVALAFPLIAALRPYSEAIRIPNLLLGLVALCIALARARRFPPALALSSGLAFVELGVVYRAVRDATPLANGFLDRWVYEIATTADALLFGLAVIVRARYVVRERRALQERLEAATTAAEHDPLTGMLNRRGLFSRAATIAAGTLFVVDLDGLKTINDRFGRDTGERVLVEVAEALRRLVPENALIGRLGDDRFVLVVRASLARPELLANRISDAIEAIETPTRLHGEDFGTSLSFVPLEGMPFENALRIADTKVYRAKLKKRPAGTEEKPTS